MFGIAWRNFLLQFHRYRVLALALTLGALVFTVLFAVSTSLVGTVRDKATQYFSGDVMVLRLDGDRTRSLEDEEALRTALASAGEVSSWFRRSVYNRTDAAVFYNGNTLVQRRLVGIDFSVEQDRFRQLDFVLGGLADGSTEEGLWVSNSTADRLALGLEDLVTLQVRIGNRISTADLRIAGVFRDNSLFGFAAYLDFRTLNRLLDRDPQTVTEIGATYRNASGRAIAEVRHRLDGAYRLTPAGSSIDQALAWTKADDSGEPIYGIFTLDQRLKQVADLISAVEWVNVLLTLVFLAIVAVGVYNTCQMIAFERTREVGTLRSLGMQRLAVVGLFLIEGAILGVLSSVVGLALGALVYGGLCLVDFSGNPLAQMFLRKGHLVWNWPWQNLVGVVGVMLTTAVVGALVPAWKVAHQPPVEALRHEG